MKKKRIKLGVNIDHVATLRNARGENDPSVIEMMHQAALGGADSITVHLREDRRHIKDEDVTSILKESKIPINLEMALNEEILEFAISHRPSFVCIVPEKREEITTEGGLNLKENIKKIEKFAPLLHEAGIEVFLFVDPDAEILRYISTEYIKGIEVHTGSYAHAFFHPLEKEKELNKLIKIHNAASKMGLEFHAGHGLNYYNIFEILTLENLSEVNIGHAIIAHSLKTGLRESVTKMKEILLV